ncbi:MAG: BLUF domain-containing protein [Phycisphaerales bacterium JB060]
MSIPVYQLAYLSKRYEHVTDENVVDDIVLPAITKNRGLGVTGCLWFDRDYFFQVLEGAPDDIEGLFETIARDNRHGSVTRILTENTGQRRFDRFGMRAIDSSAARSMPQLVDAFRSPPPDHTPRWWNALIRGERADTLSQPADLSALMALTRRVIDELAGWSDATPA